MFQSITNLIRISTVFILFILQYAGDLVAQPALFEYKQYASKGDTLLYRQLSPDYNTSRRYPLVIFLHGSGERGTDNEAQLKWGAMHFADPQTMMIYPAYVIAPQCPPDEQWANFRRDKDGEMPVQSAPTTPMRLVIELIREMKATLPIDSNRIYITGLSMGAFGTFDALARYPDLFAAAVPVCGGGDTSKAPVFAHVPIWIFHGAEDPAVDATLSIQMADSLTKAGAHPGLTIYPEVGHFSWLGAYAVPHMMEWMFRQHK
jgi:predicted peptidase